MILHKKDALRKANKLIDMFIKSIILNRANIL